MSRAKGGVFLREAHGALETDCPLGQKLGVAGGGWQTAEEGGGAALSCLQRLDTGIHPFVAQENS